MRGKRLKKRGEADERRITPADAGKTPSVKTITFTRQDHPRGCGENNVIDEIVTGIMGSPPRMRGKPNAPPDKHKANRDHPRGCGENIPKTKEKRHEIGSPPRMRGKPRSNRNGLMSYGITPADAGKTKNEKVFHVLKQDHPRGCGENIIMDSPNLRNAGSPPRMRGKLGMN